MDSARILSILRHHKQELKASGVRHLQLFGSAARGDNNADSDVDLVADLDRERCRSLFALGGTQVRLSTWVGCDVDLAIADLLRDPVRESVRKEGLSAF